jgi:lipopolysaccharide/colanic/teichoic acid biosynthesis glycosyltransferase
MSERNLMPWWKRATDLLLSLLAITVLSPVFLLCAVAIRLSSPGPLLYVAPRAGRYGRRFGQFKFRTMRVNSDHLGGFTAKHDQRIFPVGRWLRLLKVDELPQVLNVLRGEMSIVGPRPEEWNTVEQHYSAAQRSVLDAVPGLTGIPQVRFFPELSIIDPGGMDPQQHYCQVILPMRLKLDEEYIRRQSFLFDLKLILQTIGLIVFKAPMLLFHQRPAQQLRAAE